MKQSWLLIFQTNMYFFARSVTAVQIVAKISEHKVGNSGKIRDDNLASILRVERSCYPWLLHPHLSPPPPSPNPWKGYFLNKFAWILQEMG